jgi:hypothetical protein
MSKENKKNTLNDLNEFLKHQESPANSSETTFMETEPHQLAEINKVESEHLSNAIERQQLIGSIRRLARENKEEVLDTLISLIVEILEETEPASPSSVMLLNTTLYLQHQEKMLKELQQKLQ